MQEAGEVHAWPPVPGRGWKGEDGPLGEKRSGSRQDSGQEGMFAGPAQQDKGES